MRTTELIAKVAAACRPLMTAYDSDLDIDLQIIANHPHPFLHWTRKTGTDLAMLWPSDHAKYPRAGEYVEYLFGHCTREGLAHKPVEQAAYWVDHDTELVLHYDGNALHRITARQAMDIARRYHAVTIQAWNPGKRLMAIA